MSIKTDSTPIEQPKQIADTVLGQLMKAVNPGEYENFVAMAATPGVGYGDLKKKLLAEIHACFQPFQEKYRHYQAHPGEVEDILRDGALRARVQAAPILEKARKATGLSK
jgi:tryptophanyl-tRNA synthetase